MRGEDSRTDRAAAAAERPALPMLSALAVIAAVVVGTWNGNWFPSGRAEHRAHPAVEAATSLAAAKMLAEGLQAVDPEGTNDVILCLNEIRGPRAATNLVAQIGRKGLRVVTISGYRRRDRFDQQQDVIETTLPVVETHWSKWKDAQKATPPRGYAFASVVIDPATTANVYAVHLKSNYGATKPAIVQLNREKRTRAIGQIVEQEAPRRNRASAPVVIAGDMNTDPWREEFRDEKTLGILEEAGFVNTLALLPEGKRGTHPTKRYGNSALDHIFCRGMDAVGAPCIIPNDELSDHQAVFVILCSSSSSAR